MFLSVTLLSNEAVAILASCFLAYIVLPHFQAV